MRIIVEVEKWKADPEFYDMKYMVYVRQNWRRYLKAMIRIRGKLTTDRKKWFYDSEIHKSQDNLDKVKIVIDSLNN